MAEMAWMKEKTSFSPVLLLDEALAELDPSRREDLLDRLTNNTQTLLTTTDLDLFTPGFVEKATLWRVNDGRINLEP